MPSPGSVLDIGCGDGFVLQSLAGNFPSAFFTGIDIALTDEIITQITERARDCKNISLYRQMPPQSNKKPDLILLLDVLEHIADETDFLNSLHAFIHNESRIIITVPAFQQLFTEHDRHLKHFRRYNRRQLLEILEKSGFEVLTSGYIFASLLPLRILQKLLRLGSTSAQHNLHAGNSAINHIAAWILNIDAALAFQLSRRNIFIPGLSCFAVARSKCDRQI